MATQLNNIETRITVLHTVLADNAQQQAVASALQEANSNWAVARASLKDMPPATLTKLDLAHSLGDWTGDNIPVITALVNQPNVASLRDLALNFNVDKIVTVIDPKAIPETTAGNTPEEKQHNFAVSLHNKLFLTETSAVLQRMARDAELPITDETVCSNVVKFFDNVPGFNIRTASVYTALQHPDVFKGIPEAQQGDTVAQMKTLALVQAMSPIPEAVPVLMKANLTSAFQVAEMPETTFLSAHSVALGGEDIARQVYTTAVNSRVRNEHALMTMHESVRGTGLAIIDGQETRAARMFRLQEETDKQGVQLNLESLFGGTDYCECGECLSVYSPASYFVEVLNYLRNNNLDPKNPNTGLKGITGTPLEKLFCRRPDLGCLELTCENTFTVMPYIDLVNEVMESFVVHLGEFHADKHKPKQATLEAFNVLDETSGELLAIPQHINYEAYCILKSAVYPFTLPYHQPIDATRIFLNYLDTSRYELLDTYRTAHECADDTATLTQAEQQDLQTQHDIVLDRAADAEFLGMTQEEYIILTKEAFWPKHYFEITLKQAAISDQDYRDNIGIKPVWEYYGYANDADMLSIDESLTTGLTFVKKQFLKRTGILYVDLVEMLKTRFINPNYPQGKALTILESIRFSYRFLQSLVDTSSKDPAIRFGKLIDFLEKAERVVPLLDAMLHPDPCKQKQKDCCDETQDLRSWVYCYFERVGKLIVLDSGEGQQLPVGGQLWAVKDNKQVGTLYKDGSILDGSGAKIGHVALTIGTYKAANATVINQNGTDIGYIGGNDTSSLGDNAIVPVAWPVVWTDAKFQAQRLLIRNGNQEVGSIDSNVLKGHKLGFDDFILFWQPAKDTCNLEKVRLIHLDGTPLIDDEYDRMQRFIRLWRKLGWSIDEIDKALTGTALGQGGAGGGKKAAGGAAAACNFVGYDEFKDDCVIPDDGADGCCNDGNGNKQAGDWPCPDPKQPLPDITAEFLHQLVAIRKLLDQTGLPLIKLLTFWADISTAGDKSLYSKLFLTHNLLAIDKVFKADKNGDYLTQSVTITGHLPVLMAAFKLKADDIADIMLCCGLKDSAPLTLPNVSAIYRHSLLAKLLHVKFTELAEVIDLFGDPFLKPQATLELLKIWGKMEDAGFTFRQLNYLIQNRDDPLRPLAPSEKTILKTAKTLYDGLNGIDRDHPDIPDANKEQATDDLVRSKAGLLFEPPVVEKIIGLLDGTTVYTTNAPINQTITIPNLLVKKLRYSNQNGSASIQVTGILTPTELALATPLCADADWPKAFVRVAKQAKNIFNEALTGIFTDQVGALGQLLAGDVNASTDPQDLTNTSSIKRVYFLKFFLPFLRQRLAHRLIVDTLSSAAGLAPDITDILLSDILRVGKPSQVAIDALKSIKDKPAGGSVGWKGYLIPSANDDYTFIAKSDTQPASLVLDGQTMDFTVQQEDPSNVWYTDPTKPIKLKAGTLYWLEVSDRPADQLQWKTASSSNAAIPSSALLPDFSKQGTEEAFTKLFKNALLINGFSLTADEVSYWQKHATDFDNFDFNVVTLQHWKRLQAYTDLRDKLPKTEYKLLDLFLWSSNPDKPDTLSTKIAAATLWKKENIDKLLTAEHFDLNDPADFRNEVNLVKLRKAIEVAGKISVDIDRLFDWAMPGSKFWECHLTAESIRNAIRAKFNEDDWEQVVKPLNDQLRENQKQALISYLLVQQDLRDWGVVDADSLFEFFLIDVQMGACMETSRIKQAISSVQLFVQRCMLGLEADYGVANDVLDRDRWDWMQKYRVWEANRKVFLYPENWIHPELRDDKSPFYKELESEMLQKDINTKNVQDALKNYLFKVDEVANLKVVGFFVEQYPDANGYQVQTRLHVFGRTRNAPYFFYYRFFDIRESNWYPWEKVQVDIPSYDVEDAPNEVRVSTVALYRLYNDKSGDHFYTTSEAEKNNSLNLGYISEGIPCNVLEQTNVNVTPLFRLYNPTSGDHFYTTSLNEKQHVLSSNTYTDEGIACYVYPDAGKDRLPLYRAFDTGNGDHFYTTSIDEFDTILNNGSYKGEGIACYVLPVSIKAVTFSPAPQKNVNNNYFSENGTYLIPVVWNNRLLILFPQFMKKISPASPHNDKAFSAIGNETPASTKPSEFWEIKMAWSEYRNAKWTQKQVSTDAIYDDENGTTPNIRYYAFVPRLSKNPVPAVEIEVFYANQSQCKGAFHFSGNQLSATAALVPLNQLPNAALDFHYSNTNLNVLAIHTLQADDYTAPPYAALAPFFYNQNNNACAHFYGSTLNFNHTFIHDLLGKLTSGKLDDLFGQYLKVPDMADAFGDDGTSYPPSIIYNELKRPYSLYNWEAAFHAPMQLVDRMVKAQQFDQALNMIHYILDPSAKGTDAKRFWQFPPFKQIYATNTLENLFLGLQPNQSDHQINAWRNKPFQPHVIARNRPAAYMKYVAMKYIEILIAYGDYYFRQFTLETIPLAIQCYVLASHVYGPRGQKIPKRGKVQPQTYKGLLDKWDAFGNAMVEMELVFPYSNQTPLPIGVSNGVIGLANVFGFATTLYFCIPDNPQMKALRDTIDDRLFKIRHCQDIEGVTRKLPLFEPPIDPGLLVQAAAQGLSLSSVLNDLNSPMPNYRFYYLLQKALELCSEVKALSNAFLSAKEKGDAEALSQLRAGHETSIHNLVMEVKKLQLEESQKSLDALQQSRLGPVSRMQYYLKLIGEDTGKVPDVSADFSDLPNQIEQPVDESGLKLIPFEKESMDKASEAHDWQFAANAVEALSAIFHALPDATIDAMPFGIGAQAKLGGSHFGNAASAASKVLQIFSSVYSFQSSRASSKGGFLRQLQDRVQQANTAGYEIKHIDKQILAQQIRIDMANKEITNQQKQIDNAREVEDFLKNKYTNQDLYGWMEGQIRTLNYQAYTLAYDLAKRTEKIFRFERGLSTSNFIQFGYWDAGHDGLMAGERLYIGLKQLEAAYQEKRGYDFEISTPFSLRQINPLALMQLKEKGSCEFSLPEVLFDMVRPGDYMRRIKSVALTIPCIVGPYTGLSCTLRLLEHEFRTKAIVKDKNDYPKKTDETDERFSTVNVPITSIATSTGQSDSGVFELNFKDERYLPFEGAGAISKWRLELPAALRQFDYDSITDVIIQLRYTAIDGGDKLQQAASDFVTKDYIKGMEELSQDEGLFAVFDLRHDFPNEWYKATHPAAGATERVMAFDNLIDRLPVFTKGWDAKKIQATDVILFTPSVLRASDLTVSIASGDLSFTDAPAAGGLKSYASHDNSALMSGWQLQVNDVNTPLEKLWMIVRYTLH